MTNKIDMNKQYQTRDGRMKMRRVLCFDRNVEDYPVVVEFEDGSIGARTIEGLLREGETNAEDLVPVPEYKVTEQYLNICVLDKKGHSIASFDPYIHPNAKAAAEAEAARLNGGEYE